MPEPQLQRKCACGGNCSDCQKEHTGQEHRGVQLKRIGGSGVQPTEARPIAHEILRSSGQSLDAATRAFMEPRFGHDFSGVRVHSDSAAADSARAVGARAFASGRHVVFGSSDYAPHTTTGRALLADELAHTVQQEGGMPLVQRSPVHKDNGTHVHKENDKEYARTLGKADADRIRKAGTITENDRVEIKGLSEYFRGPARAAYLKEISQAILDVRHPYIEMSGEPERTAPAQTAKPIDRDAAIKELNDSIFETSVAAANEAVVEGLRTATDIVKNSPRISLRGNLGPVCGPNGCFNDEQIYGPPPRPVPKDNDRSPQHLWYLEFRREYPQLENIGLRSGTRDDGFQTESGVRVPLHDGDFLTPRFSTGAKRLPSQLTRDSSILPNYLRSEMTVLRLYWQILAKNI